VLRDRPCGISLLNDVSAFDAYLVSGRLRLPADDFLDRGVREQHGRTVVDSQTRARDPCLDLFMQTTTALRIAAVVNRAAAG
jgi:hypothetical protein